MLSATVTCERCGVPRGDGGFCDNCRVLNTNPAAGVYAAAGTRRLTARLLDIILFAATAGVGWWIWLSLTAAQGQSPAKRLLGLRVVGADGTPLSGGAVWFREGVLALLFTPLLPLNMLWALRSGSRQTLPDVLVGSVVVNAQARPILGRARDRARAESPPTVVRSRPAESRQRTPSDAPPPPAPRPARSGGPARSQAPSTSGSTSTRPASAPRRPMSHPPARSGSSTPSPSEPPAPGPLKWPSPTENRHARDEQLQDDKPRDDKPMWPGGVPPWQRGPGSPPPPGPPAPAPGSAQPGPGMRMPPPPSGRPSAGPISYSSRAHTPMQKIAELEQRYRAGEMSRSDFENERRRLIAES